MCQFQARVHLIKTWYCSYHNNCLEFRPTRDLFLTGVFYHWHCLEMLMLMVIKSRQNLFSFIIVLEISPCSALLDPSSSLPPTLCFFFHCLKLTLLNWGNECENTYHQASTNYFMMATAMVSVNHWQSLSLQSTQGLLCKPFSSVACQIRIFVWTVTANRFLLYF